MQSPKALSTPQAAAPTKWLAFACKQIVMRTSILFETVGPIVYFGTDFVEPFVALHEEGGMIQTR